MKCDCLDPKCNICFPVRSKGSAQVCGCDEGAGWTCVWHREKAEHEIPRYASQQKYVAPQPVEQTPKSRVSLPTDAKERKRYPIATGVLDYFPDALADIAHVSWLGNEQHNPGEKLHWARGKSMDQEDTMLRHFMERGTRDKDGARHTAKAAWRMLAILQLEIEGEK